MIEKRYRFVFKKEALLIILGIFIGLLTLVGISYAVIIFYNQSTKDTHSIVAGNLKIDFREGDNINLNNIYPMSLEEGMNGSSYTFTITNTGNINSRYVVKLSEDKNADLVDNKYIIVSYKKGNNPYTVPKSVKELGENLILDNSGFLGVDTNIIYNIKMWLDSSAPNSEMGKTYKSKVIVEATNTVTNVLDDKISPVIVLNGEKVYNIKTNEIYTDLGVASATDNVDKISKDNVKISYEYYDGTNLYIVDKVNTSKEGVYYIYYEVYDMNLNHTVEVRVININKENKYNIKLVGDDIINIKSTDIYTDLGSKVYDSNNNLIIGNINTIGGKFTNIKDDIYYIKYIYKDSNGIYSNIRKIKVTKADTLYNSITKNNISEYMGKLEDTIDKIYVSGSNPNNYLNYSNILFRIVAVDKDTKGIIAITDSSVTDLIPSTKVYKDSNVYKYLNDDFLKKIISIDYLIKKDEGNYINLIDKNTYNMIHKNVPVNMGYLYKDKPWLILDNDFNFINSNDEINDISLEQYFMIRPIINIKGDLVVVGRGTRDDPYLLK